MGRCGPTITIGIVHFVELVEFSCIFGVEGMFVFLLTLMATTTKKTLLLFTSSLLFLSPPPPPNFLRFAPDSGDHLLRPPLETILLDGKDHGSLACAGKVRGQIPKVAKQDKTKKPSGRAHKRMQYDRCFVTAKRLGSAGSHPHLVEK
ncbi:uncharacterized protein LOC131302905 [Rhododendron vialii]|uniref:uncharacterized protein LOC131302905 n=1 Tax=Rhododendron vialii TaxID=182163 RepID=UPI00265D6236|nr:uncharacterized protein LOC131302905 [Rhododendron vialii]